CEVMTDGAAPPSARVAAATAVLDRGWGRAPQFIDMKASVSFTDEFEIFVRRLAGQHSHEPTNEE
ncbi:MAG: hypothetical protein ABMA00_20550, partial [Gemmatimonas sp.]